MRTFSLIPMDCPNAASPGGNTEFGVGAGAGGGGGGGGGGAAASPPTFPVSNFNMLCKSVGGACGG